MHVTQGLFTLALQKWHNFDTSSPHILSRLVNIRQTLQQVIGKMIELFSSRKMIAITVSLIAICAVIIILESLFAVDDTKPTPSQESKLFMKEDNLQKLKTDTSSIKSNSSDFNEILLQQRFGCWNHEEYDIRKPCSKCTNFELKSRHLSACSPTEYKEEVYCYKSGLTLKSCDLRSSHFLTFEVLMVISSILFCYLTQIREKQIQSRLVAKINKQIASGV